MNLISSRPIDESIARSNAPSDDARSQPTPTVDHLLESAGQTPPAGDLTDANGSTTDPGGTPSIGRRSFFRHAAVGVGTAFVLADLALAYRAYDQGVMSAGDGPAFDAWDAWQSRSGPEALVGAAVLAANAHNSQPWLFDVAADRIDLRADLSRTTGANDPLNRELFVSLGCALENMMIAAPANGLRAEVLPAGDAPSDLVASVSLSPMSSVEPVLYRSIGERHSNRSEYRSDPVPETTIDGIRELVDGSVSPARLVWLLDEPSRKAFGDLLVEATVAYNADEQQSKDSFAWWRSDRDEIQRHKDGLNIDGAGLSRLIRTLGKILPAPSRSSADKTFLERTRIQVRSAAAFGVVVVDDPTSRHDQLAGGRLLQRLHLSATANGIAFQHMNQITERIDRDHQLGRTSPFTQPLDDLVGPGALAAFRIGTPTLGSARSPRRPASEVIR